MIVSKGGSLGRIFPRLTASTVRAEGPCILPFPFDGPTTHHVDEDDSIQNAPER